MQELYKYPRTLHLPFSQGMTKDDKVLSNTLHLQGKPVVVTEKMDGENTTIYSNYYHARSLDSKHKEYHSWLLSFLPYIQYKIPEDMHICGEYLYAKHSIKYENLLSYFYGFSIWKKDFCLDWKTTISFFEDLGIVSVPQLYIGVYSDEVVKEIAENVVKNGGEGVVVRSLSGFYYKDFSKNIAKYVRKNHVQTEKHWSLQQIETNKLA